MSTENRDIAMQMRCVYCFREQYAPAVYAISKGTHPCCWCGMGSAPMTEEEYRTRMRARWEPTGGAR